MTLPCGDSSVSNWIVSTLSGVCKKRSHSTEIYPEARSHHSLIGPFSCPRKVTRDIQNRFFPWSFWQKKNVILTLQGWHNPCSPKLKRNRHWTLVQWKERKWRKILQHHQWNQIIKELTFLDVHRTFLRMFSHLVFVFNTDNTEN